MTNKPNLSIEEVARYFAVTPKTVYRLAQRGEMPGFKIGGQWRFSLPLLERWVAERVTIAGRKAQMEPHRIAAGRGVGRTQARTVSEGDGAADREPTDER